ncbi:hypothetical protein [Leeuwenhoekiella sp. W20_SRS_FM14]|uniref:hypothetical protein n=1 Tax=Leeuwenhoekiella sp. W20_SRS_FM14 TaxID=3240270 RepID=UPI003F9C9C9C
MKTIKNFVSLLIILLFTNIFLYSCEDDEECAYVVCEDSLERITDFENDSLGTTSVWQGIASSGIAIVSRNGSNVLQALDGSGASFVYTETIFPSNLIAAGCELQYEVEYFGGTNNPVGAANSIIIYQGTSINTATVLASFVLNTTSLVISSDPPKQIIVPIELATSTALPSNSFGQWILSGANTTTPAADAVLFNNLIQNTSGLGFYLDSGGNPAEQWWYDNFTFKKCCSFDTNK